MGGGTPDVGAEAEDGGGADEGGAEERGGEEAEEELFEEDLEEDREELFEELREDERELDLELELEPVHGQQANCAVPFAAPLQESAKLTGTVVWPAGQETSREYCPPPSQHPSPDH